jgi:cytochrome c biogenesis protein CcmG, thiol:disulfide interchange protein DsbE
MSDNPIEEAPVPASPSTPAAITKKPARKKRSALNNIVIGVWVGILIGALALAGYGIYASRQVQQGMQAVASVMLDQPAPPFELEDMQGNLVRLEDLKGKIVVLNFWATWCGPCVQEMPIFQKYQDMYPDDLVVLGIDMQEDPRRVTDFLKNIDVRYTIVIDGPGDVGRAYNVLGLPTTFFIDQDGVARIHHIGSISESGFEDYLEKLGLTQ